MQTLHHPVPRASTHINDNTLQKRRRDAQKKGIIIASILIFSLVQILVYKQGKHHLSSLNEEINDSKFNYVAAGDIKTRFLPQKEYISSLNTETVSIANENIKEQLGDEHKKNVISELLDAIKASTSQKDQTSNVNTKTDGIANEDDNTNKEKESGDNNKKKKPLNIVLLYADDWRHDTFGAAGNPVIKTPNLDRMAKKGMMFTENCVTTSLCWISRATLQTGQYLSRHKSPLVGDAVFVRKAWNETYNYLLRKNGYYTGFVGKWHYPNFPAKEFDFAKQYYGWHVNKHGMHITKKNEMDGLKFLRNRPKDQPFALTIAFFATHAEDKNPNQFTPQKKSLAMYEDVEIPMKSSVSQESWERLPYFFTDKNEARVRWTWRFNDTEKYQHMMKNYYRMATEVDTAVGNIIKRLKKQGVYNDTLIIFTTDNGFYHGEHGLADKWYPHQESIRVPLVILDPRMHKSKKGKPNNEFTLNIDLAPTMLHAAGITPPERMQGSDISLLYKTSTTNIKWRNQFYYEHPTINGNEWWIPTSEALVRKNYKYIYWSYFKMEQLFDLRNDPLEENDLVKHMHFYNYPELRERSFFYNNNSSLARVQSVFENMRLHFQALKEAAK